MRKGVYFVIKHIILWKLKEEFNTDKVKSDMKSSLEALVGEIPGLVDLKVNINAMDSSNVDVMLDSSFDDVCSYETYIKHPSHVYVADTFVRPFTEVRSCIDFEV